MHLFLQYNDQLLNQTSLLFTQSILHGNMRYTKIKL